MKHVTINKYIEREKMTVADFVRLFNKSRRLKFSRDRINHWIDNDWLIGEIDGKRCVYNPKQAFKL